MENLQDWLALNLVPGLGASSCKRLIDFFGGPRQVFKANTSELLKVPGIRKNAVTEITKKATYKKAEKEVNQAQKENITIITWDNPDYPALLKNIHNPPLLLYVKGSPAHLDSSALAIVGARAATSYGQRVAENIAYQLAQRNMTIVSGLALGVDTSAHNGSLKTGGNTIAVLGCGVDVIYPDQNRKLYEKISNKGAIISEYPLGTKPESFRFPARNRIISGLSLGVLVVEAAKRSGSLITAKLALEQGREVFAVPGMVDSAKSEGAHRLLQEGAKLVHSVDDIIEELPVDYSPLQPTDLLDSKATRDFRQEMNDEEKLLFSFLDVYPKTIDDIILTTGLPTPKVSELLLLLEIKGLIEVLPGKQYQKKPQNTTSRSQKRNFKINTN